MRESKDGSREIVLGYIYTGYRLFIVKIKRERERERGRERATNNKLNLN